MEIECLEYKWHKGDYVKVQSHNYHKGKWISNPKWEWHQKVMSGITTLTYGRNKDVPLLRYKLEVNDGSPNKKKI
jgi:gentisate 1,2-dioxygenase